MYLHKYILIDKPWCIFMLKFWKTNTDRATTDNITCLHILEN